MHARRSRNASRSPSTVVAVGIGEPQPAAGIADLAGCRTAAGEPSSASRSQKLFASEKARISPRARSAAAFWAAILPRRGRSRTRCAPASRARSPYGLPEPSEATTIPSCSRGYSSASAFANLRLDHVLFVVGGDDQRHRRAARAADLGRDRPPRAPCEQPEQRRDSRRGYRRSGPPQIQKTTSITRRLSSPGRKRVPALGEQLLIERDRARGNRVPGVLGVGRPAAPPPPARGGRTRHRQARPAPAPSARRVVGRQRSVPPPVARQARGSRRRR